LKIVKDLKDNIVVGNWNSNLEEPGLLYVRN
jgi:hypothetical protein